MDRPNETPLLVISRTRLNDSSISHVRVNKSREVEVDESFGDNSLEGMCRREDHESVKP